MPEALVISDTSWSGPAATQMKVRAVVDVDTVNKGVCQVISDIRKKYTLPRVEVTNIIQKRTATPASQGSVTVDGKVLEPKDLMLYYEFNPRDFETHFYAEYLKGRLLDRMLPPNAEEFIMLQTIKRLNEFFENAYWRSRIEYDADGDDVDPATKGAVAGDAQYLYFDGFMKKFLDDSNTIQVGSPVALTSSNIRTKFQAGYALVPQALLYKYGPLGLKTLCNYGTQQIYEQALREDSFKNENTTEKGINRWSGYDLVPLAGMPADTFLQCIANPETMENNLYIGINSVEDNTLKLAQTLASSELWFIKGLFKVDVQDAFADQTVLYTTQTA
jgi:hypothetical protein